MTCEAAPVSLVERIKDLSEAAEVVALAGGHQSCVFEVTGRDGQRSVAKVVEAALVDVSEVVARNEAVAELARLDASVCRPLPQAGQLVTVFDDDDRTFVLTRCEFAEGAPPDPADPDDAELMGRALGELHVSLARLKRRDIPHVAALRAAGVEDSESFQLLHGDFSVENLRQNHRAVRVFDFDDCGYGPREFDIANAVYMVLFTSMTTEEACGPDGFAAAFLAGYETSPAPPPPRDMINGYVDLRVRALESWLDDLTTAPIGIRSATPSWHQTLRSFISRYESRPPCG